MIDPGLDSNAGVSSFHPMNRWNAWFAGIGILLACGAGTSCKLVLMPVRVAGAVADGVYETGKGAVDASSDAMERRKARKEKEKQEAAKKEAQEKKTGAAKAKEEQQSLLPPPDALPTQEPVIPIDDAPVQPEPLPPLPQ